MLTIDTHAELSIPPDVTLQRTSGQAGEPAANGILETIGKTPLVELTRYLDEPRVQLFAKLEAANPGGSAKDRPAAHMLLRAMADGRITSQSTIIESSSGNMGIGLAQAARYLGLPFICVTDPFAQPQNVAIMKALDARVETVDEPVEGSFLAARLQLVEKLLQAIPNSFWPNQYANKDNPTSHELGTIREIDEALEGRIDYLFVATSSTGTAQGCRDYLAAKGRATKVVAVDSTGSVLFGGQLSKRWIPGLGAGIEPEIARHQRFNFVHRVGDLECVVGCRRAAYYEAMLIGGSAGGVLETVRVHKDMLKGKCCVAILHDSGTRYMDTVFSDEWVTNSLSTNAHQLHRLVHSEPTGKPSMELS